MIGLFTHGRSRRRICDHFQGTLPASQETVMRRHMAECEECRALYAALALAQGEESASQRHRRLEGALFGPANEAPAPSLARRLGPWAGAAAALAVALVLVLPMLSRAPFDARSAGGDELSRYVSVSCYQHQFGERYLPVAEAISRRGALAFTYTNHSRQGFDRILLFGVDDRFTMYWFYPAWTDPAQSPSAYPIQSGADLRLPDEVTHPFTGQRLRVFAVFTREHGLSVRDVEQAVQRVQRRGATLREMDRVPLDHTGQHTFLLRIED